jgi:hypothetical protein
MAGKRKLIIPAGQKRIIKARITEAERLNNNGEAILQRFPELQKFLDQKILPKVPGHTSAKKMATNVAIGSIADLLINILSQ